MLIDNWGFGHHADGLWRAFLDMLLCAWPDQIELKIRRGSVIGPRRCEIPAIDVIITYISNI